MNARNLFLAGVVAFVASLAVAWLTLPEQVPLHYDLAGVPDRLVGRGRAVLEMGLVGGVLALLLAGLAAGASRLPLGAFNVPHKEYWSRPENEPRLRSMTARDAWAMAALTMALLTAIVVITIVEANSADPSLGISGIMAVVLFVVALIGYLIRARRRYRPGTDT